MSCQHSREVHAWHDGQLPADQRPIFEQHLSACTECQAELKDLASLSRLFAGAKRPSVSPATLRQLHDSAEILRIRTIIHIAARLTAAASILLAIGLFALLRNAPTPSQPVAAWENVMVDWQTADATTPFDPETGSEHLEIALWLESGPLPSTSHD